MPRNISFMLTQKQFRNRTKTVTRRLGWKFLKKGDILNGCEKCQGIKKGEKIVKMGQIRVVDVRQEQLRDITDEDVTREGFPEMSRREFMCFFIDEMKPINDVFGIIVTRIEFEYID